MSQPCGEMNTEVIVNQQAMPAVSFVRASGAYQPEEWFFQSVTGATRSDSGVSVNADTAMTYSSVWQAVNIISQAVSQLPLEFYMRDARDDRERRRDHAAWVLLYVSPEGTARSVKTSALTFRAEFYSDAQATSQYMGAAAIDENDWTQDSVFAKYDVIVEPQNQAAYAAAYADMMEKISKDVDVRSYGLGAIYFGRDAFTHWVWTGARSIPELSSISEKMQAHSAFAEFYS